MSVPKEIKVPQTLLKKDFSFPMFYFLINDLSGLTVLEPLQEDNEEREERIRKSLKNPPDDTVIINVAKTTQANIVDILLYGTCQEYDWKKSLRYSALVSGERGLAPDLGLKFKNLGTERIYAYLKPNLRITNAKSIVNSLQAIFKELPHLKKNAEQLLHSTVWLTDPEESVMCGHKRNNEDPYEYLAEALRLAAFNSSKYNALLSSDEKAFFEEVYNSLGRNEAFTFTTVCESQMDDSDLLLAIANYIRTSDTGIELLEQFYRFVCKHCGDTSKEAISLLESMAWRYLVLDNDERMFDCIYKTAKCGHSESQYWLGVCYENGSGAVQDTKKAASWYRKAAIQEHSAAQYRLGRCYEEGIGVKANPFTAVKWYRKASRHWNWDALYRLGRCYEMGTGTAMNFEKALECYRKSARCQGDAHSRLSDLAYQGNVDAQYSLAEMLYYDKDDDSKAEYWYRKAAEQGHELAQARLKDFS